MSDDFSGVKVTADKGPTTPYTTGQTITGTLSGSDVETETVITSDSVVLSGVSTDGAAISLTMQFTTSKQVVTQDSVKLVAGTYTSAHGVVFTVPAGGGLTATATAP